MDTLVRDGFVVLGGPLGDGERILLFVVDAETECEIHARLAEDPWIRLGLLEIADIDIWEIC